MWLDFFISLKWMMYSTYIHTWYKKEMRYKSIQCYTWACNKSVQETECASFKNPQLTISLTKSGPQLSLPSSIQQFQTQKIVPKLIVFPLRLLLSLSLSIWTSQKIYISCCFEYFLTEETAIHLDHQKPSSSGEIKLSLLQSVKHSTLYKSKPRHVLCTIKVYYLSGIELDMHDFRIRSRLA